MTIKQDGLGGKSKNGTYRLPFLVRCPRLLLRFGLDQGSARDEGFRKRGGGHEISTHSDFPITLHYADLDILGACLYDLKQTLHSQFDTLFPCQIVFVILLQEFTDGFR